MYIYIIYICIIYICIYVSGNNNNWFELRFFNFHIESWLEWESNPQPHTCCAHGLATEISGRTMRRALFWSWTFQNVWDKTKSSSPFPVLYLIKKFQARITLSCLQQIPVNYWLNFLFICSFLLLFSFLFYFYQILIFQNTKYQVYTHLSWLETWRRFK